jgi:hypothetical protein
MAPRRRESLLMHSPQMRLARALYHEWRLLPERERGRLAAYAREVKELALDLRGAADTRVAEVELSMANEALAIMIMDSVERDRDRPEHEVEAVRRYLQAELYRAAPPRAA